MGVEIWKILFIIEYVHMTFRKAAESLVCSDKIQTCSIMLKTKRNFWVFDRRINMLSFYNF
jgi:hypothetical protein